MVGIPAIFVQPNATPRSTLNAIVPRFVPPTYGHGKRTKKKYMRELKNKLKKMKKVERERDVNEITR